MKKMTAVLVTVAITLGVGAVARPAAAKTLPVKTPACGDTVTKSFRLGADMNCTGHGLVVGKSEITIDLNGHTIRGDGDPLDFGIFVQPENVAKTFTGVRIRNGAIRRFGDGIYAGDRAPSTAISNVVSVDNTGSGFALHGKAQVLKNSTSTANDAGVTIGASARKVVVSKNQVVGNEGHGLRDTGTANAIRKNAVIRNGSSGIRILSDKTTVFGNTVAANGNDVAPPGAGIIVLPSGEKNVVEANRIFGNGDDGYRDTGTSNKAIANLAHGNGYADGASDGFGTGIDASAATDPLGGKNRALGNDATTQCVSAALCVSNSSASELPLKNPGCGGEVTESFRLSTNLTCTGNGIVVAAHGITVDLNGHTVRGDGGADDRGVDTGGYDEVTVQNGVVRRFNENVSVDAASLNNTVRNVVAVDATDDAFYVYGRGAVVENVIATAAGGLGITVISDDVSLTSVVSANNIKGMHLNSLAEDTVILKSEVVGNEFAMDVSGQRATISQSVIAGNNQHPISTGVKLAGSAVGTLVTSSKIVGNGGSGYSDSGGGNRVFENLAHANGYANGDADGEGSGIVVAGVFPEGGENVARGNDGTDCVPADFCV